METAMTTKIKFLHASVAGSALPAPVLASKLSNVLDLTGRTFLVSLFLISGINKIGGYEGTAAYMEAFGVPGELLPVVIGFEVLAAIAVIIGWMTRFAAALLAGFTMLAALIFHSNFSDSIEVLWFLDKLAITGGFLLLIATGPGPWSIDRRIAK
jgi:putative oxidoreductase